MAPVDWLAAWFCAFLAFSFEDVDIFRMSTCCACEELAALGPPDVKAAAWPLIIPYGLLDTFMLLEVLM